MIDAKGMQPSAVAVELDVGANRRIGSAFEGALSWSRPSSVFSVEKRAEEPDGRARHALIGGHAVNAYLEPRFTADIDVTVQADVEALERVRTALALRGYEVSTEDGADLPSGPDFVRFTAGPGSPTSPAIATAED